MFQRPSYDETGALAKAEISISGSGSGLRAFWVPGVFVGCERFRIQGFRIFCFRLSGVGRCRVSEFEVSG